MSGLHSRFRVRLSRRFLTQGTPIGRRIVENCPCAEDVCLERFWCPRFVCEMVHRQFVPATAIKKAYFGSMR